MLEPAPPAGRQHPVDRLRPKGASEQMIDGHHPRSRDEDAPVPIEGQKCQGAEDVKVGFDATAREVEERKRSEEHTSELQSRQYLVCRLLLEKKKNIVIKSKNSELKHDEQSYEIDI